MSYDVVVTPIDTNGYYSPLPTLTGSVFVPPSAGAALSTVAGAAATPFTLKFPSPPIPPSAASAMLITEGAGKGDVLRTGTVASLPPSPATPIVITIPPVPIPGATVAGLGAGFTIPTTAVPTGIQVAVAAATGGTFIPLSVALPTVTLTLVSGAVTITAAGTLVARQFFGFVNTIALGFTGTFTITPSADAVNTLRVLRVTPTSSALTGAAAVLSPLAPFLAGMLASILESKINATIASLAASTAASMGVSLTTSAVISAHNVTIVASSSPSGGGIILQLVLASLFGMPTVTLAKNMNVTITPAPVVGTSKTYTVTVTDSITGGPVGAAVTLQNFLANGNPQTATANTNPGTGVAQFPNITLHNKTISVVTIEIGDDGKPHHVREVDELSPVMGVTATGYNPVSLTLV
jgi:hypothetical protein